jgi:hypothetical protein
MATVDNNVMGLVYLTEKILADINYTNEDKIILKNGLDELFKIFKEYDNHCCDLYNGIGNRYDDNMYLSMQGDGGDGGDGGDSDDSDEECIGCETGADCIGAHTDSCNRRRGFI